MTLQLKFFPFWEITANDNFIENDNVEIKPRERLAITNLRTSRSIGIYFKNIFNNLRETMFH